MNFWPHISILRDSNEKINSVFFNKQKINTADFMQSSGKPLIIIASGPSVSNIDTDFFDSNKFDILGVNGSYKLSKVINFKYHVIIDRTFIINRVDIIMDILNNGLLVLLITMECLNEILINGFYNRIKCKIIIIEYIDQPVYKSKKDLCDLKDEELIVNGNVAFSLNLNKGFYDGSTVSYTALQIAFFLNYKEIYFAGLDMNNFDKPRFYEKKEDILSTELDNNLKSIIIPCFELAKELAERNNITVYNLSMDSAINSFEKIEYNSIR
jgi:Kdo-III transferase WaaZ